MELLKRCALGKAVEMCTRMRFVRRSSMLMLLAAVQLTVALVGCADSPAETPEAVIPPAATPTDAVPASPSGVATPTLMEIVAADTRHFKGDPNAPVTIIEFGDFQ